MIALLSRTSFALEGATEPIRIDYRADRSARCPSAREFEEQVFARTQNARPASESEPARTFVVELRQDANRVAGTLVVQETGGASVARHVTGSECANVASVLALATALAIDPRAELAPHQELEPSVPPPPPPVASVALEPPPKRRDERWVARVSVGASAAFGIAPRPFFGPSVLIAARRDGALLEELGLGFVFWTGAPEVVRGANAEFQFYAARPMLCIHGIELAAPLRLGPCVAFEAGVVRGAGSELPVTSESTRFWAAAEALLRLELSLPRDFFVTLEGGVALPLTRYRFVFKTPDTAIHEVPAVAAHATVHLGMGF